MSELADSGRVLPVISGSIWVTQIMSGTEAMGLLSNYPEYTRSEIREILPPFHILVEVCHTKNTLKII